MKYIKINTTIFSILFWIFTPLSGVFAQNLHTLKGVVKNEYGEKLIGANIKILDTNYGASTDNEGNFTIKDILLGDYTLKVSHIGMETAIQNIKLKSNPNLYLIFILKSNNITLQEITVKGQSLSRRNSINTISIISNADIKNLMSIEQPLRILEQVPGVNVASYGQGGVADQFSIRGFQGGHAGGAGMQIDGVSLNEAEGHADGYSDMGVLIPLNLSQVKVYKGPASVLFGRYAMGGTVALETRKYGEHRDALIRGGSFGTFDIQYAQGNKYRMENEREIQTNFALQMYKTNGYMEHSDLIKTNVEGRISLPLSDRSKLAVSFRGHKSIYNAPGFLTNEQYYKDRRKPNPTADNDGGSKNFMSERIDYSYKVNEETTLLIFGYAVQQDFTRYAKFSTAPMGDGQSKRANKRNVISVGGSLNGKTKIVNRAFNWIVGAELYDENTSRERWNTFNRVEKPNGKFLDVTNRIASLSGFAQGELNLHQLFKPSIGFRYDTFAGEYHHIVKGDENEGIETISNLYNISPKLGFRSTFAKGIDFRTNISKGFYLSTDEVEDAKYNGSKPSQLWQYEVGISYKNIWLDVDFAAFILNSSKEIQFIKNEFVNTGKTERKGIEISTNVKVAKGLVFNSTFAYTKTQTESGTPISQVPDAIFTVGANYVLPIGVGADINFRYVSDYFVEKMDNGNDFYAGGYKLTNLSIFYDLSKITSKKGRIYMNMGNLFNEKYAETYFSQDFIAPAPTRNISIGLNYTF